VSLLLVAALGLAPAIGCSSSSPAVVEINWMVGLGTGFDLSQVKPQQAVVKRFNESHPRIHLTLDIVEHAAANAVLDERIAAGKAPDIIGPIGITAIGRYHDLLLPMRPDPAVVDLSHVANKQLEAVRNAQGDLLGIPIGLYPSFLYVNTDIFTKAGLPLPPAHFGERYRGKTWDMDNLRETAMLLTLDSAGRNATDPRFDPDKIVQWGLMLSDSPRSQGTFFGAGSLQAADGSAQIPKAWMSAWTWYHQLMWADHAAPNTAQQNTVLLGPGGGFSSGNIAMGFGFTWFLSLLLDTNGESMTFFDFAVTPEYNGTVTSQVNADVFSVLKTSAHPKEAQEVLGYLLGEAAADLVQVYGPVPARDDIRSAAIERFAATHVSAKNWSVFSDSIAFPDAPSAEEHLANSDAAEERLAAFGALLAGRANVDINLEAAKLQRDLNTIFAKGTSPANTASASTAP
jgi:multiple sugar transport system substrate-binding protein